ncbi:prepilin-type N-terminal cleavage/methylation domain-containing protein [Cerasicoccus frondis]|uniref:prepilin-type N-terminal cleavage/methylation domain-containing protein n=1 Tax=Cerasicoccus frondis TaxID=490090 RepID=UPI0028526BA7|nr:prepilin-type N-terminal cleavage/methylation domain-containing protein [Cerasicoccus frondis]
MKPHSPKNSIGAHSGFTLLELLTVIAIFTLLVVILFPVYQRVEERADAAKCSVNMRSIGAAFNAYAADNNGYFPAARLHPRANPDLGPQNENGHWETEIAEYVGYNIRQIAGEDGEVTLAICPHGRTGMNGNVANRTIDKDSSDSTSSALDYKTPVALVTDPSNVLLLGDADDYHCSVWKNMKPDEETDEFQSGDPIRHLSKANYLFVDGHVELLSLDEVLQVIARGRGNL